MSTNVYCFTNSKGKTYYLHCQMTKLHRSGLRRPLYYFRKAIDSMRTLEAVPAGYEVMECKTGLPVLKKEA